MPTVREIFNSLKGQWRFQRTISGKGTVIGKALFKEEAEPSNILHYREEGEFVTTDGQVLNVYREYSYCCHKNEKDEDEISVHFIEHQQQPGRLFHRLYFNPISPHSAATALGLHHCGEDTYKARYEFLSPQRFTIVYDVRGPNKSYISETSFERIEPNAVPIANPGKGYEIFE